MTPQISHTITDQERRSAIARLESSRDLLHQSIAGVSAQQSQFRAAPDRWSILDLVEHLAISEDSITAIADRSLAQPAQPELIADARKKDRWFGAAPIPGPSAKHTAPGTLHPNARFNSVEQAFRFFQDARARTIAYVQAASGDLRSHFHLHPQAGQMDGYQWLVANAIHAETHAQQIDEVKTDPDYPRPL